MSQSIKVIREILTAWHRAGAQSIEWPVCRACHGYRKKGPRKSVCRVCKGTGTTLGPAELFVKTSETSSCPALFREHSGTPPRQGETDSMGVPSRIIILGVAPSVPESPRRIDRV